MKYSTSGQPSGKSGAQDRADDIWVASRRYSSAANTRTRSSGHDQDEAPPRWCPPRWRLGVPPRRYRSRSRPPLGRCRLSRPVPGFQQRAGGPTGSLRAGGIAPSAAAIAAGLSENVSIVATRQLMYRDAVANGDQLALARPIRADRRTASTDRRAPARQPRSASRNRAPQGDTTDQGRRSLARRISMLISDVVPRISRIDQFDNWRGTRMQETLGSQRFSRLPSCFSSWEIRTQPVIWLPLDLPRSPSDHNTGHVRS